ncbi:MAG: competence protein, partial [Bacteroides sp.]|nr:competence protein [Bacteroides sp.]
ASIDYLYVSHGYRGGMAELIYLFSIGKVVLAAYLSDYCRHRIVDDCIRMGIPYLSLSQKGSVLILL